MKKKKKAVKPKTSGGLTEKSFKIFDEMWQGFLKYIDEKGEYLIKKGK